MAKKREEFEYDVAVSFAGENRSAVEQFVSLLQGAGLNVFYDTAEQGKLWGKDLYEHLDDVYKHKARFCVMFISEHYAKKRWTNHERKSAQERAFKENREYILPVRFDDTVIPGLRDTVGYLDLRQMKIGQIAELAIDKIRKEADAKRASKAKGKKTVATRPAHRTRPSAVVDNSDDWVLLNDGFYQAQSVERPNDKLFAVTIISKDAATDSRMEAIRNHSKTGERSISFAYANDAYIVRCESAASTYAGGAHQWKITLVKEDIEYGGGLMEMAYSSGGQQHFSAEDFARMRAERILLGNSTEHMGKPRSAFDLSDATIESFIQGINTPIKVTASPIVELAKKMPRTDAMQFLRFARLVTLFYLKASGVVERIEQLFLGPLKSNSVHVAVRGVRRKKFSNVDPEVITVEGDCPLPMAIGD